MWSPERTRAVRPSLGPLAGGAVPEGIAWQWIFWINVPIGLVMLPLARTKLSESHGPNSRLDLPGLALASTGLLGIVWALVRGGGAGWTSAEVLAAALAGVAALAAFVAWELRAPAPMLPMRFFRSRAFAAANAASLAMYFGMFGSVFLLTQFLQLVMGYGPLEAGVRTLALDGDAGVRRSRRRRAVGPHRRPADHGLRAAPRRDRVRLDGLGRLTGHRLRAARAGPRARRHRHRRLLRAGRQRRHGRGGRGGIRRHAIREIGGVLGVAVLAAVFASRGDYATPTAFVAGFTPAVTIGAVTVALGAVAALLIPRRRTATVALEPALQAA